MSDFNKILAFQNIIPYLNEDKQVELAKTLGMNISEINRRLVGKNKEDEFILILLFIFILEIKHTDKEKDSISGGNLNKRIDYAPKLGLKLFFAISIKGYWILFDSDY